MHCQDPHNVGLPDLTDDASNPTPSPATLASTTSTIELVAPPSQSATSPKPLVRSRRIVYHCKLIMILKGPVPFAEQAPISIRRALLIPVRYAVHEVMPMLQLTRQ